MAGLYPRDSRLIDAEFRRESTLRSVLGSTEISERRSQGTVKVAFSRE